MRISPWVSYFWRCQSCLPCWKSPACHLPSNSSLTGFLLHAFLERGAVSCTDSPETDWPLPRFCFPLQFPFYSWSPCWGHLARADINYTPLPEAGIGWHNMVTLLHFPSAKHKNQRRYYLGLQSTDMLHIKTTSQNDRICRYFCVEMGMWYQK